MKVPQRRSDFARDLLVTARMAYENRRQVCPPRESLREDITTGERSVRSRHNKTGRAGGEPTGFIWISP